MKSCQLIILIAIILTTLSCVDHRSSAIEKPIEETPQKVKPLYSLGKTLFTDKCSSCYRIEAHDGFDTNFWKRLPEEDEKRRLDWFIAYISNSDSLAKSGDAYAVYLKNQFNHVPSHRLSLSKTEALAIIHFCTNYDAYK